MRLEGKTAIVTEQLEGLEQQHLRGFLRKARIQFWLEGQKRS